MNKMALFTSVILSTTLCINVYAKNVTSDELTNYQSALTQTPSSVEGEQSSLSQPDTIDRAKLDLKNKLSQLHFFSAEFSQKIVMESGEVIQENKGKLALTKPNSLYWETYEPDELFIISKDNDVWFYNPWIDEASVYSVSMATAKTPLLLLTSTNETLWQQYNIVEQVSADATISAFVISSIEPNSQIKPLTLSFSTTEMGEVLSTFAFLDATGQTSIITLSDFDKTNAPDATLFEFTVPEGVAVKDHRTK